MTKKMVLICALGACTFEVIAMNNAERKKEAAAETHCLEGLFLGADFENNKERIVNEFFNLIHYQAKQGRDIATELRKRKYVDAIKKLKENPIVFTGLCAVLGDDVIRRGADAKWEIRNINGVFEPWLKKNDGREFLVSRNIYRWLFLDSPSGNFIDSVFACVVFSSPPSGPLNKAIMVDVVW